VGEGAAVTLRTLARRPDRRETLVVVADDDAAKLSSSTTPEPSLSFRSGPGVIYVPAPLRAPRCPYTGRRTSPPWTRAPARSGGNTPDERYP